MVRRDDVIMMSLIIIDTSNKSHSKPKKHEKFQKHTQSIILRSIKTNKLEKHEKDHLH